MTQKDLFKSRLKAVMEMRRVKPIELSRRTGISQSTISQYRSGYSTPKADRLQQIADALNVSPMFLLGLTDDLYYEGWDKKMDPDKVELTSEEETMIQKLRALPDGDIDFVNRYIDAKYNDNY